MLLLLLLLMAVDLLKITHFNNLCSLTSLFSLVLHYLSYVPQLKNKVRTNLFLYSNRQANGQRGIYGDVMNHPYKK
jgi:hypothetical protein